MTTNNILTLLKYRWKSITIAIVIFYLSTAPSSEFSAIPSFPNEDKLIHFLMYFGFAAVLLWDSAARYGLTIVGRTKTILLAIGLPVIWGGSMELIQQYCTTTRSGDWRDEVANSIGTIAGYFTCRFLLSLLLRKRQ